ncbi:MAG: hypothetical protein CVV42_10410 [Candidatus Riflebacteria bacterium HGW-Riflebacteria-2]|nr:MAG: hypothetical protein CVV42_10410 [Candidatus Riflebacteria bacterium HGW-Riflebacteria-2]
MKAKAATGINDSSDTGHKTGSLSMQPKEILLIFFMVSVMPVLMLVIGWQVIARQHYQVIADGHFSFLEDKLAMVLGSAKNDGGISKTLEDLNRLPAQNTLFGRVNLATPEDCLPSTAYIERFFPVQQLIETAKTLRFRCETRIELPDGFLAIRPVGIHEVVFGFMPASGFKKWPPFKLLLSGIGILIVLLTGSLTYWIFRHACLPALSVRWKLVGLFLYATAFPGCAFLCLGIIYIQDREKVLLQQGFDRLETAQQNLEENFLLSLDSNIHLYQKLIESDAFRQKKWPNMDGAIQKLRKDLFLTCFMVTASDGNTLYSSMADHYRGRNRNFALMRASQIISHYLTPAASNWSAEAMVAQFKKGAGGNEQSSFQPIHIREPWLVSYFFGFASKEFMFLAVASTESGENVAVAIGQDIQVQLERFWKRLYDMPASDEPGSVNMSFSSLDLLTPADTRPASFKAYLEANPDIREKLLWSGEKGLPRSFTSEDMLFYAQPSRWDARYISVWHTSRQPIRDELRLTLLLVITFSLVSTVFAFGVGLLLAGQFLWPVKELAQGISAIQSQNFAYRIPVLHRDELGDLGDHFNQVIPQLEEMQVGKAIQATLLPDQQIKIEGWEIEGQSEAMTSMMGDFYDYQLISDRYLTAYIGDVAGHGAPAALLMAMTKGAVNALSAADRLDPGLVLSRAARALYNPTRRKMVTMAYLVLDLETSELAYANAGHCYPLLFTPSSEKAVELSLPSSPLGVRKKCSFPVNRLAMEPGSALLMYSDGLPEALNKNGKQFGYNGLAKILEDAARTGSSAGSIWQPLKAAYNQHIRGSTPTDDVTLLVLRRAAEKKLQS